MPLVNSTLGRPFHVPASNGVSGRSAREELREQGGTPEDLQKTPGAVANALSSVFGQKDTGTRLGAFTNTDPSMELGTRPPAEQETPEEQGDLVPDTRGTVA